VKSQFFERILLVSLKWASLQAHKFELRFYLIAWASSSSFKAQREPKLSFKRSAAQSSVWLTASLCSSLLIRYFSTYRKLSLKKAFLNYISFSLTWIFLSHSKNDWTVKIPFSPFISWKIDNINNEIIINLWTILKTLVRLDLK
jgi:hypothetical protein